MPAEDMFGQPGTTLAGRLSAYHGFMRGNSAAQNPTQQACICQSAMCQHECLMLILRPTLQICVCFGYGLEVTPSADWDMQLLPAGQRE